MAILNSTAPPTDFSPHEYQCLIEKYLALSQGNDRLVKAIRSGNQIDIDHIRQVLQTDFPLYVRLQDYFSRLRAGDLGSVVQTSFVPDDPILEDRGVRSRPVDVNTRGDSEMHIVPEHDPDAMSMFSSTEVGAFVGRPPIVPNQGPFGIRFSDFPPRVISQMLSAHMDVVASSGGWSSCISPYVFPHRSFVASWRGLFTWAGFGHASRAKRFTRVPMIGLGVTSGKDLYAKNNPHDEVHTHPNYLRPQTNTYMAAGYDPPPIRNKARERCCLTGVDKAV